MKCNKFYKTIWALSAILTGFSIVLFAHGLLLLAPQIASTVNVVNASSLSVTCAVSTSTPITGGTVTWLASASGGTGSYTFSWSGTDALTGTSGSVSKVYTTAGVKTASVSASFGGSSASCSSSIIVTSAPAPACSDGVDNDGDGSIDFPADIGCASGSDTDESNIPLSASCSVAPTAGSTGSAFTWTVVPAGGVTGIYTFTWSGTDGLFGSATTTTKSYLTAGTKTGSVTVTADTETIALSCANSAVVSGPTIPPQCSDGIDNDGDGSIDFPADLGCSSALDNDETNIPAPIPTPPPTLTPTSAPLSSSGGGGGGGPRIRLQINNEKVVKLATSTALVTWDTNLQAQSKVFYGKDSHASSSLPFIEYTSSTEKGISSVTKHSMTITGLDNDATYYFRPAAFRSDEEKGGIELMLTPDSPSTPVTPAMCSKYLLKPIKFGEDNDIFEVTKLQIFLNDFEGYSLDVTGIYNLETFTAVEIFQEKYADDILTPWGIEGSTGYVYITTMKKINEIYCNKDIAFNLDDLEGDERREVEEFNALLESLRSQGLPLPDTSKVGFFRAPVDTRIMTPDTSTSLAVDTDSVDAEGGLTIDTSETIITQPDSSEEVLNEDTAPEKVRSGGIFGGALASIISAIEIGENEKSVVFKSLVSNLSIGNIFKTIFRLVF